MERLPLPAEELLAEEVSASHALHDSEVKRHETHLRAHPLPRVATKAEEVVSQDEEFQAELAQIPSWQSQLTLRGLTVGLLLGSVFCVVVHKMNLGPGIIPSLNIAAGLLAFMSLQGWTWISLRLGLPTAPFGAQECNAIQTFVTACSSVAFTGGFGSYIPAMSLKSYELLGGDTAPGNRIQDVFEPSLSRLIPYLLSISVVGVFMLVALRKTMIIDYNLTFPSGTATGLMVSSFFTTSGAETARAQMAQMGRWFSVSLIWSAFKWLYSGANCSFCSDITPCGGFEKFPLFGMAASQWTWYLNLSANLVGAGMICPLSVNLSLLAGAFLTWGFLWPLIASKEGNWYLAGQSEHAFSGLFGYKVFITIAMLLGDGLYNLGKVSFISAAAYYQMTHPRQPDVPPAPPRKIATRQTKQTATGLWSKCMGWVTAVTCGGGGGTRDGTHVMGCSVYGSMPGGCDGAHQDSERGGAKGDGLHTLQTPLLSEEGHGDAAGEGEDRGGADRGGEDSRQVWVEQSAQTRVGDKGQACEGAAVQQDHAPEGDQDLVQESALEQRVRRHVFLSDTIPLSWSACGYLGFGLLAMCVIPRCYPAVRWYHVVVGALLAPLLSLPVSFGCGLTDWDVSSMFGKLAIFCFAAWVGLSSGGVIAGLAMSGVILSATSTSATLMQDFRTGFIVKCAPKAMFFSQLAGVAAGALIAPLTFTLFWSTGKVGDPDGPYPTPYAAIFRAMAIFGTSGLSVLPQHCGAFMLVFFIAALVLNLARDLLPSKVARLIPIPMAMAIPFVLGAYIAVDMVLGSIILLVWEWAAPASAALLAPAVASGLIVGDGLFSVPMSLMSMVGINAPMCMSFSGQVTS